MNRNPKREFSYLDCEEKTVFISCIKFGMSGNCSSRAAQQGHEIKPQKEESANRVGNLGVSGLSWLKTLKSEQNKARGHQKSDSKQK